MEQLTMELTTYQLDMVQAMELLSPLWGVDLGNCRLNLAEISDKIFEQFKV